MILDSSVLLLPCVVVAVEVAAVVVLSRGAVLCVSGAAGGAGSVTLTLKMLLVSVVDGEGGHLALILTE